MCSISRRLITKISIINNQNIRVISYMSSILEKALWKFLGTQMKHSEKVEDIVQSRQF